MTAVKCMKRVPETGLACQLQAGHKHRHSSSVEPSPAVPPAAQTVSIPEDLQRYDATLECSVTGAFVRYADVKEYLARAEDSKAYFAELHTKQYENMKAELARAEATIAELVEKLGAINRITSPGNHTLDDFMRDMGYANDIARAAIARATGKES